jgi:hypothetical protein
MIELHLQRSLKKRLKRPKKRAAERIQARAKRGRIQSWTVLFSPINYGAFSNQSRASLPRADQRGLARP